ncbi:MAG: hypothetical protein LBN00_06100 [Oscillospiraceae bacterium]|jgi:hypothetical protein|nr:hypothetical protein [Oscillospiraceae bacterium]
MNRKQPKPYDPVKTATATRAYDASVRVTQKRTGGLYSTFEMRRDCAAALANGGDIRVPAHEKTIKELPLLNALQIAAFAAYAVMMIVTIVIAIAKLTGKIPTDRNVNLFLPLAALIGYFGVWINLITGYGKHYTSVIIFCDEFYQSGPFQVAYERIKDITVKEKTQYNDATVASVALHADGKQVGHDRMYYEDYEHLAGVISAFQRHLTAP